MRSYVVVVRGHLCQNGLISKKKVCFDFAVTLCSIGAPYIPKNVAKRSEMENMVFWATPIFTAGKLIDFA